MKYIEPSYEKIELETEDIMSASGTISNGDVTISGKEETFSQFFEDLLG